MGGLLRRVFTPYAAGFVTSMACAALDGALSTKTPMVRNIVKLGGAVACAYFGRRYPVAATAAIAAIAASQGYAVGLKAVGGMAAASPAQVVQKAGEMADEYPEMGALLAGGVGALLSGMGDAPNLDANVANYMTAVNNLADED